METSLSIPYLIQEPTNLGDNHPLILLLHGYGSNEEDLFSFASELDKNAFIISARAPYDVVPYGHAWYSISFDQNGVKSSDHVQAAASRDLIVKFIDQLLAKYPIDPLNVNLVGFSQGAILSYAITLSYPHKINKTVALSGYLEKDLILKGIEQRDLSQVKIFASHGTVDQVIPIQWAKQTPIVLEELKVSCQYKEYPVGHGVHPLNFHDFKAFLED